MDKDSTVPSARPLSNRISTDEDTLSEDRGKTATQTGHVGMTDDLVVDASLGEIFRDERGERQSNKLLQQQSSPLARLMERTGYSIVQQNGQRRYGPPPSWDGPPPPRGCEVFVGKIPRDCFEDELVPVFERTGDLYEMRLMMDYNGQNRGYAFVVYTATADAKECVKLLNNYEIRKVKLPITVNTPLIRCYVILSQGRTLGVCMSVDNCRLFVGGIPKRINKDEIREEMDKVTEGVVDVIVYPSASDKSKNRGFAFVEYESHRVAAMARRKLMNGRVQLWGHQIAVDWAEPELEVAEEIMAHVCLTERGTDFGE